MHKRPKNYSDLIFWKKAFETAKMVLSLTRKLSRNLENNIIISQLLRSAMSVAANTAEGYGRYGKKEFVRYLQISLGSANETECWLMLLKEANKGYAEEIDSIINLNNEVIRMLATSIKTIKSKGN
jgi:four helix bundle protein